MKGQCFISQPGAERYHQVSPAVFSPREESCQQLIKVFPQFRQQRVEGFGGSFTESAGVVYNSLPEATRKQVLQYYFGPLGNRYTMARLPIQSCDFSLGNHASAGSEQDILDGKFDFSRDREYIMPFIRDALAIQPELILMASPWSPPAFMKSNQQMNRGGYLLRECYELWAELIVNWLLEYRRNGISITRLSVQNEPVAVKPWESCLYSVEEESDFAINYLNKALARHSLADTELYIWDHDKDGIVDWAERVFADEIRREAIDGIAFHWYTGDHFAQIQHLARRYPEKKLLFTEGCVPAEGRSAEVQQRHGSLYLHDMIGNFNAGACGHIDWNLLLDDEGGPNHQGNRCEAPIQCRQGEAMPIVNQSWHFIGHFSRYVRPGAEVVLSSSYDCQLETAAFVNPDGERVLVVFNHGAEARCCRVVDGEWETQLELNGWSAATLIWSA
ncbi:glycoside hydrolase family 30 protein (plasmid) [Klebsiella grimontii]